MALNTYLLIPYTSTQNGRAERKHRYITKVGLTLLVQAQIPIIFLMGSISYINLPYKQTSHSSFIKLVSFSSYVS